MPARATNSSRVRPGASRRSLTATPNGSWMSVLARLTIAAKLGFRSHTAPRPPVAVPKDRIVGPLALYVLHRHLSDRGRLAVGLFDGG